MAAAPDIINKLHHLINDNDFEKLARVLDETRGIDLNVKIEIIKNVTLLNFSLDEFNDIFNEIKKYSNLLCIAVAQSRLRCARMLIAAGVDVNGIDSENHGALMIAVLKIKKSSYTSLDTTINYNIIELLINSGANCDSCDENGNTILMHLCLGYNVIYHDAIFGIVELLLEHGANRELVNGDGLTAVQIAMGKNYVELGEFVKNYQIVPTKGAIDNGHS